MDKFELLSQCGGYLVLAQGSEIMVVSIVNFRVLAHDRTVPGSVIAMCEKKAAGGGLAVVCGEAASPTLRHYSLPGLKIASEENLPGGGSVGRHVKLQVTASGEVIHFSVVDQALVRCSKKGGRQTFGQPRKGLYSFGADYVCSVSTARDSLNVYLENNPRYCVKYKLDKAKGVAAMAALGERVHVALGDALGRILLVQASGDKEKPRLVATRVHWHSLPVTSLRWNGDGKYLYSGGGEAVLVKWNVAEAKHEAMAPRLGDVVEDIHVSDETIVARLADGTAHSFDTQLKIQNSGVAELHKRIPNAECLFWHAPTQSIAMSARANFVDFYHPPTRKTILSLEVNDANIVRGERDPERRAQLAGQSLVRFAMSPSGQTLATLHDESSVKVWRFSASEDKFSLESYIVEAHEEEDGPVRQCEVPADEMVVTRGERSVRVWRKAGSGDMEWFLQSSVAYKNQVADAFAVSPDLSALAVAHGNLVALWNLEEDSLRAALSCRQQSSGKITSLSFGAPSSPLTLFCASDNSLCSWDLLSCQAAWSAQLEGPRIKKASAESVLVICGDGVRAVADDGRGVEKVSEKRVSNFVYDFVRGDYHYVLPDGRLDQSRPAELLQEDKEVTATADLLSVSRIAKAEANPLRTLRTPAATTDSLVHKPVSLNLNRLLMEAL